MKRYLIFLGITLLVMAAAGVLVMVSGIVPVKASSGHWPITEWILHFAMKRSVATHSTHIDAPPLDRKFLLIQGAGHYDVGCYGCHGGPGAAQPSIALRMTPHPPDLVKRVHEYNASELFYIVRHGVKFTGMPAWASDHRDDEVWAMVSFLQQLPNMSRSEYERLSGRSLSSHAQAALRMPAGGPAGVSSAQTAPAGSGKAGAMDDSAMPPSSDRVAARQADAPLVVLHRCAACHALDGHGREAHAQLAGQRPEYLNASLRAYRSGQRHSGIMQPIAYGLSDEEISQAVAYYSGLETFAAAQIRNREAIERGEMIAMVGLPEQRVGSCIDCHGPADFERSTRYPYLAGQHVHYLVQQLHLFRSDDRGGSDHAQVMHTIAKSLTNEQIADVAAFYASQQQGASNKAAE